MVIRLAWLLLGRVAELLGVELESTEVGEQEVGESTRRMTSMAKRKRAEGGHEPKVQIGHSDRLQTCLPKEAEHQVPAEGECGSFNCPQEGDCKSK